MYVSYDIWKKKTHLLCRNAKKDRDTANDGIRGCIVRGSPTSLARDLFLCFPSLYTRASLGTKSSAENCF